jgi:hypothetical protein
MNALEEPQSIVPSPSTADEYAPKPVQSADVSRSEDLEREIQKWGIWWAVLGMISVVPGLSLSPVGAIVLIFIGLSSLVFRTAAMLAVFATSMAIAALFNIASGETGWVSFALVQLYMSGRTFVAFRRYRYVEVDTGDGSGVQFRNEPMQKDPSRFFPWLSMGLGFISLFAFVAAYSMSYVDVLLEQGAAGELPVLEAAIKALVIALQAAGELGLTYGAASLLARHRGKIIAILGILTSVASMGWFYHIISSA